MDAQRLVLIINNVTQVGTFKKQANRSIPFPTNPPIKKKIIHRREIQIQSVEL
jgi:hypothetical protein